MWNVDKKNGIVLFISPKFKYRSNVCVCSMNRTLIRGLLKTEVQLFNSSVADIIRDVSASMSIIIIDNQFGMTPNLVQAQVGKFFQLIDNETNRIPFIAVFMTKRNIYKKPQTNIWTLIKSFYERNGRHIDLNSSLYIGSDGGRFSNNIYTKDRSDVDRAFSANIGMMYRTPEQIFSKDTQIRNWAWNYIMTPEQRRQLIQQQEEEIPFEDFLVFEPRNVILVVGPPSSGKTMLANRIQHFMEDRNPIIIDINKFLKTAYCVQNMLHSVSESDTIVVDVGTKYNVQQYITALEDSDVNIICVELQTTESVCMLLNQFKLQISKSPIMETHPRTIKKFFAQKPLDLEEYNVIHTRFPLILQEHPELFYRY